MNSFPEFWNQNSICWYSRKVVRFVTNSLIRDGVESPLSPRRTQYVGSLVRYNLLIKTTHGTVTIAVYNKQNTRDSVFLCTAQDVILILKWSYF